MMANEEEEEFIDEDHVEEEINLLDKNKSVFKK